jgi:hypothetical protein
MSTRDLGKHIVELHEQGGMLAITGEGTRVTLSAEETLSLLNWLSSQKYLITQTAQAQEKLENAEILETVDEDAASDDKELPMDEP